MKRKVSSIPLEFNNIKMYLNLGAPSDKVVTEIPLNEQYIEVNTQWLEDEPYFVIYTTDKCNLSCEYCFHNKINNSLESSEPVYSIEDLYNFFCRHDINAPEIRFFGGEPLLNKKWIYKCVNFLKEKNMKCKYNIFTNGTLIDNKLIEFSKMNEIRYFISIAGQNEVEKGIIYRSLVDNNIKKLLNNRIFCVGRTVYNPNSVNLVSLIADIMKSKLPALSVTLEWGSNIDLEKAYSNLVEFSQYYINCLAAYNFSMIGIHPFIGYMEKWIVSKQYDLYQCGYGKSLYSVSTKGEFYPCHCFTGMKDYKCGNIYEEYQPTLEEIDGNSLLQCSKCYIKYFCKYRCFADAFFINKDIYKMDENKCQYEKMQVACSAYILYTMRVKYPKQNKILIRLIKQINKNKFSH